MPGNTMNLGKRKQSRTHEEEADRNFYHEGSSIPLWLVSVRGNGRTILQKKGISFNKGRGRNNTKSAG